MKKGRVTPTKTTTKFSGQGVTRPFINKRNRLILRQGVTRPFINKRNCLILGSGKKKQQQRGGFLGPLLATLAPTAVDLLKKVIK